MSATLSALPRRTGPQGSPPVREMPILFHLMDVSRLRLVAATDEPPAAKPEPIAAAPPEPKQELAAVAAPATSAVPEISAVPENSVGPEPLASSEPVAVVEPLPPPTQIDLPEPAQPISMFSLGPAIESAITTTADEGESVSTESEPESLSTASVSTASLPESAEAAKPTNAEIAPPSTLAEKRTITVKSKQPAKGDWFTAHGRYIAIGFVLALLATIYLARSGRNSPAPVATNQPHAHPGDASHEPARAESKPVTVVSEAKSAEASTTPAETSPAKLAEAAKPAATPQADLHPPTVPKLAADEKPPVPANRESLFPWANPSEDRLATRPSSPEPAPAESTEARYPITEPRASSPPTYSPPPSFTAPAGPAPSAPAGGANRPAGSPPEGPAGAPGQYQSIFAGAPAPAIGQPPAPPAIGGPPAYAPQNNSASGIRYERTGSGVY